VLLQKRRPRRKDFPVPMISEDFSSRGLPTFESPMVGVPVSDESFPSLAGKKSES